MFPLPQHSMITEPKYPTGFNLKFILLAPYGDQFYIGLNGIQIYDENGRPILTKQI